MERIVTVQFQSANDKIPDLVQDSLLHDDRNWIFFKKGRVSHVIWQVDHLLHPKF
jgi:hypothetical protein